MWHARRTKVRSSQSYTNRNYWPTMHKDARKVIRECQECQVYHPMPRNPQQKLTSITSPWPFYKWGVDIAGPFPKGPDKRFASVKNPQANGLVERANRSLGEGIDMVQNDEALKLNLDRLEEKREQAAIREARSKAEMKKYYNSQVRNTSFKLGDLVYRSNDAILCKDGGSKAPK
ncbi:reverse transcriptase domain-containing protein [Tanacetum coccineum]